MESVIDHNCVDELSTNLTDDYQVFKDTLTQMLSIDVDSRIDLCDV